MEKIKGYSQLTSNAKALFDDYYNKLTNYDKQQVKSVTMLRKSEYILRIDFFYSIHRLLRKDANGKIILF